MDILDIGIWVGFIAFGVALATAIIMEAFNLLKDPKQLIAAGIVIAIIAVLFFVSYSFSSDAVTSKYTAVGVDAGSSKLIGAGLIMLYICVFTALIGMVISEIYKAIK